MPDKHEDPQLQAEIAKLNKAFADTDDEFAELLRSEWGKLSEQYGLPVEMEENDCLKLSAAQSSCSFETVSERGVSVIQVVDDSDAESEFDVDPFTKAVLAVLKEGGIPKAKISVALVDDAKIHELNRQFLNHDYPTDVITFPLGEEGGFFHGEIVVSVDTAKAAAARLGWPVEHELLLYVIHGALHLVGYDDQDDDSIAKMRAAERRHLARFGLIPPVDPMDA